ncbi:MAG: baseplate J/gp47 family protein [Gammaproteobacteria bacterium]
MSEPICPCDTVLHPAGLANLPGLTRVHYRAGDFLAFRRALLQALPGETALTLWRPAGHGDLLLQLLEWWAYVADVLTFYNEQSLNENLLATASTDAGVRRLVKILGYRPRPGIGGTAEIGVLFSGARPLVLPAGFQVQSKPAPGQAPQTFETTEAVTLVPPAVVDAAPPGVLAGAGGRLYLDGKNTTLQPGDALVLAPAGAPTSGQLLAVTTINHAEDSAGQPYTEIVTSGAALPAADAAGYRLLASRRAANLWKYSTSVNLVQSPLELDGVDRAVAAGQALVLSAPGTGLAPVLLTVTGTTEQIWYTNGDGATPPASPTIPAGAPHTRVSWTASPAPDTTAWNNVASKVRVLLDWQPAGTLRNVPQASYNGTPPTLLAAPGQQFRVGNGQQVLIEGADGLGAAATGSVLASTPTAMQLAAFGAAFGADLAPLLATPLRVLTNKVNLSRGKSVGQEVLGVGNASTPGQSFTLAKGPLTYLAAGDGYRSTLRVYVNGVEWHEVPNFYGQAPDATVFVTFEDDEQKTHVQFGDWVNGSGLPSGAQVTAWYRIESGAEPVPAGGLSVIARPAPGVTAVRHPTPSIPGADPDQPAHIRRDAPRSILTFGRAISADDYDAIAARAPGVARVRSYFAWNAEEQRATVKLYVGDTPAALTAAKNALRLAADPNRRITVLAATPVPAALFMQVRVTPDRVPQDVAQALREALSEPDTGLFGANRLGIGESIYFSQLSAASLAVPGVQALGLAFFYLSRPDPVTGLPYVLQTSLPPRIHAAENEVLAVPPALMFIYPEGPASA